jgi:DNA repair protein RadC
MSEADAPRPPRRRRKDNHEFGVVRLRELPLALPSCDCPERIYDYWLGNIVTAQWYNPDVECLCVVHVNTRRRATGFHLVGIGTLDTVVMHPREIFRTAIVRAAAALVIVHNHPSGDPTPSEADIKATRDLSRAGQLLRIEVLDHVIIGRPDPQNPRPWASLRELGYFT